MYNRNRTDAQFRYLPIRNNMRILTFLPFSLSTWQATLNDLDRAVKMDVLTCCEPVTAYLDREGVYQPLPRPLPPGSSAALVDLLADKPLRYRVGRQPGNQIYIR